MSTSFVEKIEKIRGETGLSQSDFSEKIGISINTYKSLLKRNGAPRFELIESIAAIWPEYCLWLLTDQIEPDNGQFKPSINQDDQFTDCFNIVDSADARFMDKCATKAEALKKLIFIQNAEDENDLAAIITIDNGLMYQISNNSHITGCLWVSSGNINFFSNGGGRLALSVFRDWLMDANSDLVSTAEIRKLKEQYFNEVYKVLKLPVSAFETVDNDFIRSRFEDWKSGIGYGFK